MMFVKMMLAVCILIVVIIGKCVLCCPRCPVVKCVRHRGDIL